MKIILLFLIVSCSTWEEKRYAEYKACLKKGGEYSKGICWKKIYEIEYD